MNRKLIFWMIAFWDMAVKIFTFRDFSFQFFPSVVPIELISIFV